MLSMGLVRLLSLLVTYESLGITSQIVAHKQYLKQPIKLGYRIDEDVDP